MFIFSIHILEGKTLTMVGWSYVYLYVQCICTFWYICWWCYFCLYFQCICTFLSICICVLFRSTLTTRTVRKPRWSLGRIALVSGAANNTTWQLLEITSEDFSNFDLVLHMMCISQASVPKQPMPSSVKSFVTSEF